MRFLILFFIVFFVSSNFNNYNKLPDRMVIRARAAIAPVKTVSLGCLIAIIAAIKNVLSPSSDTIITESDAMNAWINPKLPGLVILGSRLLGSC